MSDDTVRAVAPDEDVVELTRDEWVATLQDLSKARGSFEMLGTDHAAAFTDQDDTLFVTFETIDSIMNAEDDGLPMGFSMSDAHGWSQLTLLGLEDGWFRSPELYAYFDRLVDDGFFENYDRVVFYGAGDCAYAAAAYSVAAPGATVLALQPRATLDADIVPWDTRNMEARRAFTSRRYAFAPDMLDAADHAYVLYDPEQAMDAMHASLFTRPNVTRKKLRHLGGDIERELQAMAMLDQMIEAAMDGALTPQLLHQLYRARRGHLPLLRSYLNVLHTDGRSRALVLLSRHVLRKYNAPRFRRLGEQAVAELAALGVTMDLDAPKYQPKPKAAPAPAKAAVADAANAATAADADAAKPQASGAPKAVRRPIAQAIAG